MKTIRLLLALVFALATTLHAVDYKISDLPALTSAATSDLMEISHLSSSKKITLSNLSLVLTPAWANLTGKPTTLSGFGLTDAQPLDGDLTALAAVAGTNTIYYRAAANTWSAVAFGGGLSFTAGTLTLDGAASVTTLAASGGTSLGGTLAVTGTTVLAGNTSINAALTIGTAGTAITKVLSAVKVAFDCPSIAAVNEQTTTLTVTGATTTSVVLVTPSAALPVGLPRPYGRVTVADTVTLYFENPSAGAIDPASMDYRVVVINF